MVLWAVLVVQVMVLLEEWVWEEVLADLMMAPELFLILLQIWVEEVLVVRWVDLEE